MNLNNVHVSEQQEQDSRNKITLGSCSSPYLTVPDSCSQKSLLEAFLRLSQWENCGLFLPDENSHSVLRFQNNQQIIGRQSFGPLLEIISFYEWKIIPFCAYTTFCLFIQLINLGCFPLTGFFNNAAYGHLCTSLHVDIFYSLVQIPWNGIVKVIW